MSTDPQNRAICITKWQWTLFCLLQCFNLYQVLTHAMWRDELQTWSMVRESGSLLELVRNMRYDGFPPLWYLCLWGLSFIFTAPLAMQVFHFVCSFAAQLLVMTRAPFSGAMKLALLAGYYISFEYCVISRAYVLGVLLLFSFCAFYNHLQRRPLSKGVVLGLLANTSVYGAILSLAFVTDEVWHAYLDRHEPESLDRGAKTKAVAGLAIYSLFLLMAVCFMLPPKDGTYAAGFILTPDLGDKISVLCRNLMLLVPMPTPKINFWNTLPAMEAAPWIGFLLSVGVVACLWHCFRAAPRYGRIFCTGFIGIWLFSIVKYAGTIRHGGAAMILFIGCIWCAEGSRSTKLFSRDRKAALAVCCLLAANVVAWGIASYQHMQHDFSGSREMAAIILQSGKSSYPIVADVDYAASPVAGYLGRPLFYATSRKPETFIKWNVERLGGGGPEDTLDYAASIAKAGNSQVLLLLNYPIETARARFVAKTRDAIVSDEVLYLYEYLRQ